MIGNALTWIFDKVLEIIETVIEWIGFIFDRGDIQATHRSIVSLTRDALDTWAQKANGISDSINAYFDNLSDVLRGLNGQSLPDKLGSAPADKGTVDTNRPKNSAMDSTKVKWSQYHCTHSGAYKGAVVQDTRAGATQFEDFWSGVLELLIDTFGEMSQDIGRSIFDMFNATSSTSPKEVLSELGTDLLLDLLDGNRKIAIGITQIASPLLEDFKSAMNYKITIPVFSFLYKKFLCPGWSSLDPGDSRDHCNKDHHVESTTGYDEDQLCRSNRWCCVVSKDVTMQFSEFANVTTPCCRPIISAIEAVESVFGLQSRYETGTAMQLAKLGRRRPLARQPRGAVDLAKKYWQDVFAVVATLATIPRDPDLPAYGVRWGSWTVSTVNRMTSMALRRVDSASSAALKKGLGVQKILLGAVNYALVIAIKVEEFEKDFADKVEALIVLDCVSGTFDLVGCTCDGAAMLDLGKRLLFFLLSSEANSSTLKAYDAEAFYRSRYGRGACCCLDDNDTFLRCREWIDVRDPSGGRTV